MPGTARCTRSLRPTQTSSAANLYLREVQTLRRLLRFFNGNHLRGNRRRAQPVPVRQNGNISFVPTEDRISGPGTNIIMAAYTHLNPDGSRFPDISMASSVPQETCMT